MRRVMVRYVVKGEAVGENVRLIEAVFAELERSKPAGLRYTSFKLPDGVSFMHLASIDAGTNPLLAVEAFKAFTASIEDRCVEPPASSELERVGGYSSLPTE